MKPGGRIRRPAAVLVAALTLPFVQHPALAAPPRVLFVGDSITEGRGATDPDAGGFVALLAERFPGLEMANAGCSGSTVRDWTEDLPGINCAARGAWVSNAEPELPALVTHVMLGTNDAIGGFERLRLPFTTAWVPPEEYEARLRLLLERSPGLILLSTPPTNPGASGMPVDDRLLVYREIIFRLAAEHPFVETGGDIYAILDPASDFDKLHPNDAGHHKIARELERRILDVLPQAAVTSRGDSPVCSAFTGSPEPSPATDRGSCR